MDTRMSSQLPEKEVKNYINTLCIDFSEKRIGIQEKMPYILSLDNPKKILLEMIRIFGFEPRFFSVSFGAKTKLSTGRILFRHGIPISSSNKVKIIFSIDNNSIGDIQKKKEFISTVAHELCHVLLIPSKHQLSKSEVATDLLSLIIGFDLVYTPFRVIDGERAYSGYLSASDLKRIQKYISLKAPVIYL